MSVPLAARAWAPALSVEATSRHYGRRSGPLLSARWLRCRVRPLSGWAATYPAPAPAVRTHTPEPGGPARDAHSASERPHATAAVTGRILDFNNSSVTAETANAKLLVHGQLSCERPYDCSSLGRMVEGHPDVRVRHVVWVRECDRVIVVRASLEHGPPLGRNALACAEEDSQSTAHGAATQQRRPATVGCAGDGGAVRCMSRCRQTGARYDV